MLAQIKPLILEKEAETQARIDAEATNYQNSIARLIDEGLPHVSEVVYKSRACISRYQKLFVT